MKVSILIPAYNSQDTIYTSIRSAIKQTYKDLEVIVVDDGSTDNTKVRLNQYAKHYNNQLRVIQASHMGVSAARNRLLYEARGEYVFFLDADDFISPETIESMMKVVEKTSAEVVVCGNDLQGVFGIKNCVHSQICPNRREVLKYLLKDRSVRNYAWGKLMKKELWNQVEFPINKVFEDIATVHKVLIKSKKTVIIPSIYYHYNVASTGSITYGLKPEILNDMMEACRIQAENILEFDPTLKPEVNRMLLRNKVIAAMSLLKNYQFNKEALRKIFEIQPRIFHQDMKIHR
ncbi:glycosyltransferase family 2 protein [Anaerorhabdus furcosa]|uniref:Glycosyl transferase family 2 n=1 Tax=Anaerorhabdus furcosa TaxID=118967 RepID=A0A1T4MS95_9FIRM|nr:glycosyltransferase family A protein [Anaerorhabdus furcosa]SJZ69706.1 Glycosyl transferase family 2 [Anaerorhabdus furcosa]